MIKFFKWLDSEKSYWLNTAMCFILFVGAGISIGSSINFFIVKQYWVGINTILFSILVLLVAFHQWKVFLSKYSYKLLKEYEYVNKIEN